MRSTVARCLALVALVALPATALGAPPKKGGAPKPAAPDPKAVPPAPPPEPEPVVAPEPAPVVVAPTPPPAPPPPPAPAPSEADRLAAREMARVAGGHELVAISASVDLGVRAFSYSDPIGKLLANYTLGGAPMASVGLEAYPFAASEIPWLRDLGFRGRVSRAFALDSQTNDGVALETAWSRFGGEARERILLGGPHALAVGVLAGLDASYFDMRTKTAIPALLPAARTVSVRVGVDASARVAGPVSLGLGAAYLAPTSRGEIYDRFRAPSLGGVDLDVSASLALAKGLDLRLFGRYTRYFAAFSPNVGDPLVAGGALDEQLQVGLGVRHAH